MTLNQHQKDFNLEDAKKKLLNSQKILSLEKQEDSKINEQQLKSKINGNDFIEYIVTSIKKKVKCEDVLIRLISYTGLSSYIEEDPINLGIIAPTSEGKTYPVEETLKFFPKEDVYKVGAMSTKALIREKGILVDKYNIPLEERLRKLRIEKNTTKNPEEREKITTQIQELYEDSKSLIDLTGKILVFLEPPQKEVWTILKPILSHDSLEIEYPFVDKNERDGLYTKKVVVRGWPSCVFCSAKDESKWEIWPEIKSRLLITSPNMIPQKYKESNLLISQTKGLPNIIQRQIIISEDQITITKQCVLFLKQKINELKKRNGNNKISVWIPYYDLLQKILPANKGTDVRFAKKLFSLLNVVSIVKNSQKLMMNIEGETSIISDLSDLKEVLSIIQNFDGIPKFKIDFYNEIFLPCYQAKTKPDSTIDGKKTEEIIAVTSKQLCEFFKEKKGKPISTDNLKHTYLNQLINEGVIDYTESKVRSRQYIYYPLVIESLSISSIMSLIDKSSQQNLTIYEKIIQNTSREWIFYEIMWLVRRRLNHTNYPFFEYIEDNEKFWICNNNQVSEERNDDNDSNFISIGEFVEKYVTDSPIPIDNKPSSILLDFAKRNKIWSTPTKIELIDNEQKENNGNSFEETSLQESIIESVRAKINKRLFKNPLISDDDLLNGDYDYEPEIINNIYRNRGKDIWFCENCDMKNDKWGLMKHPCKRNKKNSKKELIEN
ncbi:MAG: hypothetical protein ACPKPY_09805 [Nitrososphaeraceae archaeon]